jgi:Zn ribbon nucleic-acid-binding protein
MIDFNYIWVDMECPKCKYQDEIQLIDAKTEIAIFCNNCKCIIQLHDSEASVHTGVESINDALKDLEDLFKNFGK